MIYLTHFSCSVATNPASTIAAPLKSIDVLLHEAALRNHCLSTVICRNVRTHTIKLNNVHETTFENCLSNDASSLDSSQKCHKGD